MLICTYIRKVFIFCFTNVVNVWQDLYFRLEMNYNQIRRRLRRAANKN